MVDNSSIALDTLSAASTPENTTIGTSLSSILLDGKTTSHPPEKTTFDRRIQSKIRGAILQPISPKLKLKVIIEGVSQVAKVESETEPRLIEIKNNEIIFANAAFHYRTESSIQLTFGAKLTHSPSYSFTSETPSVKSKTKTSESRLFTPYFGILKKAGFGIAGIVYKQLDESKRTVIKVAETDNSRLETDEITYDPESISLVLSVGVGSGHLGSEITSIKAGEGGPRRSNGNTTNDDFMRFRVGYAFDGPSALNPDGISFWFAHQTLSYSSSQDISLNTIPLSSLRILWQSPVGFGSVKAGLVGLYGSDKKSIPEFNASLAMTGVGGEFGLEFKF